MSGRGQSAVAVTQDPQAVSILAQCLGVSGGAAAISAIRDYTANGNITYYWADAPVQGTVTLQGLGAGNFRLDAALPDGTRSWAVSNGQGFVRDFNGTTSPLYFNDAANLGGFAFPFLSIAKSLSDTSVSVASLGLTQLNGQTVYQIQLRKSPSASVDPNGKMSRAETQIYEIDSSTFQLVDVQYLTFPNDHTSQTISHELQYSGFQKVNGLLLPFTITELISGQQTMTIQLSTFDFNTGLSDAMFQP